MKTITVRAAVAERLGEIRERWDDVTTALRDENTDLFAHACEDIPWLLAQVERFMGAEGVCSCPQCKSKATRVFVVSYGGGEDDKREYPRCDEHPLNTAIGRRVTAEIPIREASEVVATVEDGE